MFSYTLSIVLNKLEGTEIRGTRCSCGKELQNNRKILLGTTCTLINIFLYVNTLFALHITSEMQQKINMYSTSTSW